MSTGAIFSVFLSVASYRFSNAVLPDECFTPVQPCPTTLKSQYCLLNTFNVPMSATDCKRSCINQTISGTPVNGGQTVYCAAMFYKSPSTCQLYYQKGGGGGSGQGYRLRTFRTRQRQARQTYQGRMSNNLPAYGNQQQQQQSFGPPTQNQYRQQQNNYQPQQQTYPRQNNYQQQGNYGGGGSQCECGALKPGCGKTSGDTATTGSPNTATTSGASCFQGPQKKELAGNAIASLSKGDSGFDGTLATCQAACKALAGCKSLNFYAEAGTLPANCVLHDKQCTSQPDACADNSETEYWENTCSTRLKSIRNRN